jgi:hypothetical protein
MSAGLFPKFSLFFNRFNINLFVVRKFDGNFFGYKFATPFGKPNFTKSAFAKFVDFRET